MSYNFYINGFCFTSTLKKAIAYTEGIKMIYSSLKPRGRGGMDADFLCLNPFSALSDCLSKLDDPCGPLFHIKDAKSGKYLLGNHVQAKNFGFQSPNELIGLTARDLEDCRLQAQEVINYFPAWKGKFEKSLEETYAFDRQVLVDHAPVAGRDVMLSVTGLIYMIQIVKAPLLNSHRKIIAICTLDYDVTHTYDLLYLFKLYKQYFPIQAAIPKFLSYLKIEDWFLQAPTHQEILVLLLMSQNPSYKYVAKMLNDISPRTIEEYKKRLLKKLKRANLNALLIKLRTCHVSESV